jgi:hypothetical protein
MESRSLEIACFFFLNWPDIFPVSYEVKFNKKCSYVPSFSGRKSCVHNPGARILIAWSITCTVLTQNKCGVFFTQDWSFEKLKKLCMTFIIFREGKLRIACCFLAWILSQHFKLCSLTITKHKTSCFKNYFSVRCV